MGDTKDAKESCGVGDTEVLPSPVVPTTEQPTKDEEGVIDMGKGDVGGGGGGGGEGEGMNGVKLKAEAKQEAEQPEQPEGIAVASEPQSSSAAATASNGNTAPAPSADLIKRIVEQMEFYFGDINLPRDRFLQEELKKDDGWVPLTTMMKFNRLAQITTDVQVIAEAMKQSKLIELSEDEKRIRRNPEVALPENSLEYWQSVKHRTVYIKGFKKDSTLDEIQTFMKQFGEVDNILMRREKNPARTFKGSTFVTYKTREMCEKFVQNDVKQFNGCDLIKMMQDDYWEMKQQQMRDRKAADRNAKLAKKAAEAEAKEAIKTMVTFSKGMILAVEGFAKAKEAIDLLKIKEFFKQFGDVAYVVYKTGDDTAQIRFAGEEHSAKKAWDDAVAASTDGKVIMDGCELNGSVLGGEEEEKYWNDFNASKANKQARFMQNKRGRGGRPRGRGGRGGRGGVSDRGARKRDASNEDEGAADVKKAKKIVFPDDDNGDE